MRATVRTDAKETQMDTARFDLAALAAQSVLIS